MTLRYVKSGDRQRVGLAPRNAKNDGRKSRGEPRAGRGLGILWLATGFGVLAGLSAAWLKNQSAGEPGPVAMPQTTEEVAPSPANEEMAAAPSVVASAPPAAAAVAPRLTRTITDRIRPGETLSVALTRHGVEMEDVNRLVVSLKGSLDMRGIRPGDVYILEERICGEGAAAPCRGDEQVERTGALRLDHFSFKPKSFLDAPVTVRADREVTAATADQKESVRFRVERQETPIESKVVALGGEIQSSLYVSMIAQGEDSNLVNRFVDVFAWDIDFYRETQKGDRYKVLVEKQYAEGRFIGYGRVLAAEYVNAGRVHRGFNFRSNDQKVVGIFDDKGKAMEKTFLKNPLEVARITSRYGQRFHPVLRRQKKHNGVDYGAGRGTPFWAVADGTIKEARYSPTAGNMIVIRHANGYETEYFHAARFAKGIRAGSKVKQREVIGYVGNTGRSTGPHLHFGMRRTGSYVDPARQVFPVAKPVPDRYLKEYLEFIKPLLAEIEAVEIS